MNETKCQMLVLITTLKYFQFLLTVLTTTEPFITIGKILWVADWSVGVNQFCEHTTQTVLHFLGDHQQRWVCNEFLNNLGDRVALKQDIQTTVSVVKLVDLPKLKNFI